jgi:hypothetical protein
VQLGDRAERHRRVRARAEGVIRSSSDSNKPCGWFESGLTVDF